MEKKLGILTFHRAISYGAVLQTYALQNFLQELGIDNEIVDYKCDYMINRYQKTFRRSSSNPVKDLMWSLKTAKGVKLGRQTTAEFVEKNLKLSKPYNINTISQAASEYSAFISGSDQVWSPTCVGFDPVYFLTFAKPEQKYSYAASIAVKQIPENIKAEYTKRISDFSGYSVREQSGAEIVKQLTGKEALINIDPTFLLNAEQWDKLATSVTDEPYIFLFTVLKPKNLIDYALKLSKEKNMKIIYLNNRRAVNDSRIEYMNPVTADKFAGLIKNASYVCTNSFHGNAFSVIYNKKFVVETDTATTKNIRSQELMEKLGLAERILSDTNTPDIDAVSDFERANSVIEAERKSAAEYLRSIKL